MRPPRWLSRATKEPASKPRRSKAADPRVVYQVASLCLQYPDDALLAHLPMLSAALDEQHPSPATDALRRLVDHLATTDPATLREDYIELFDLSRRQTLYLTYWSDGDTRRRGSALADLKARYRKSGFLVDTGGELTDFLPMVLEFTARVDTDSGREVLIDHRASLELIRIALQEKDSPYADALVAVCATLPGQSPRDKASALALRQSPPAERVGLDAGDPRLLPLFTSQDLRPRVVAGSATHAQVPNERPIDRTR